jgi:hypothetical protein
VRRGRRWVPRPTGLDQAGDRDDLAGFK